MIEAKNRQVSIVAVVFCLIACNDLGMPSDVESMGASDEVPLELSLFAEIEAGEPIDHCLLVGESTLLSICSGLSRSEIMAHAVERGQGLASSVEIAREEAPFRVWGAVDLGRIDGFESALLLTEESGVSAVRLLHLNAEDGSVSFSQGVGMGVQFRDILHHAVDSESASLLLGGHRDGVAILGLCEISWANGMFTYDASEPLALACPIASGYFTEMGEPTILGVEGYEWEDSIYEAAPWVRGEMEIAVPASSRPAVVERVGGESFPGVIGYWHFRYRDRNRPLSELWASSGVVGERAEWISVGTGVQGFGYSSVSGASGEDLIVMAQGVGTGNPLEGIVRIQVYEAAQMKGNIEMTLPSSVRDVDLELSPDQNMATILVAAGNILYAYNCRLN